MTERRMMKTVKQSGSVLIEALIAVVVLGIGIVAIAQLQGSFIREGANSQARNIGLQLAQQRLDDLRTYHVIMPATVSWPVSVIPYSYIQDDLGGSINWFTTSIGNSSYTVSWKVDNYQVTGANDAPVLITYSNTYDYTYNDSSYKAITMTVSWTDMEGNVDQVQLNSYISKLDAYGQKFAGSGGNDSPGPEVAYNPGAAPDVIAIDTAGESVETTLPEPAIKTIAGADYFYSQFETVTYDDGGIALREEEFLNIRCECEYNGTSYQGSAFPVARSIWHPDPITDTDEHLHYISSFFHPDVHAFIPQTESERADLVGNTISKVIGQSSVGNSAQHPFCNICCRDHHDGNYAYLAAVDVDGVTGLDNTTADAKSFACDPTDDDGNTDPYGQRANCFDPWRPEADYITTFGDHKHYDASGTAIAPDANNSTQTYQEACRLKRVNGKFKVFQDWHLHGTTYAAAAKDAYTPGAPNSIITQYIAYIKNYVTQAITNQDNLPVTTITNPATSFVWPPSGNTIYPITTQFIARGIYMDYMDPFMLSTLDDIRVNQPTSFFENVAFNEINLTRLTDWQPECVNPSNPNAGDVADNNTGTILINGIPTANGCVTNFDIELTPNGLPTEINRGFVQVLSATDSFALQANMLLSNTGLVGNNDFLPEDNTPTQYPTTLDLSYDIVEVQSSYNIGTPPSGIIINVTVTRPPSWNDSNSELEVLMNNVTTPDGCSKQAADTDWICTTTSSTWTGTLTVSGEKTGNNGTIIPCSTSTPIPTLTKTTGTSSEAISCE